MSFPPESSQQSSLLKSPFWVAQNLRWLPITCRSVHSFLTMTSETFPDLASAHLFLAQLVGTMNARTAWCFFTSACCLSCVYGSLHGPPYFLPPRRPPPTQPNFKPMLRYVSRSTPSSILPCWVRSLPFDSKNLRLHLCLTLSPL